jgi:hypothetical protein
MTDEHDPQRLEELRRRLEALQKKLEIVTNKETRAEVRYEIAKIQWQLGLISDEEFHQIEEFYESFTYEWC